MAYDGTLKFDTKINTSGFGKGISEITRVSQSAYEKTTKTFLGISGAIAGIGTAAVKITSDFDTQMSKVKAISGATGSDFDALRDKAREMGAKTKFSATESGEAFEYMAMAGWKTEEMLDGIEGVMNLAAASGVDLGKTSDIVTDALTAFGLEAKDSGHFADILAAASANANTNVDLLGESFKYVAPVAGAMKMSAEDTALALGLMANSGIKASMGGTALRNVITRMAKPTKDVDEAMSALGLTLTDEEGNVKSLKTLMDEMRVAFAGCTDQQKAQYAASIAGKQGMSGLLAIVNASEKDYNSLTDAIYNCDGATQEMAETMIDNLGGQLTILKSQLQELAISIGDTLVPTVRKLVGFIQGVVDKFNSLDQGTKEMIVKIAMVVAAIGPALLIAGKFANAFLKIRTAVQILGPVLKSAGGAITKLLGTLVTNPIFLVVAAIAALVAGFIYLWKNCEGFRNFFINMWEGIKTAVSTAIGFVQGVFTSVVNFITSIPEKVTTLFTTIWTAITTFFTELPGKLLEFFTGIVTKIGEFIGSIVEAIASFPEKAYDAGVKIGEFVGKIILFFMELPGKIWEALTNAVQKLIEWGANVGTWIVTNVPILIGNIVQFFSELPGKIWTWLVDTITKIGTWGADMVQKGKEAASNFLTNVVNFVKDLPSKVWEWLTSTVSKAGTFATDFAGKAKEAASSFFNGIVDKVKEIPGEVFNIGKDIVTGIWNGINSMWNWFWESVSGFFGGIVDGVKNQLGIQSPSKVFAAEVGRWIPPGVEVGIDASMPDLLKNARENMGRLASEMQATVTAESSKISVEKAGAQEYDRALAERRNNQPVNVSGTLESDRPIVVEANMYLDKRKFAKEVTPAINHEMYKIDSQENNRGRGN